MARVKPKRQGIQMDLTAMSDMAWLLLTFFILTTHFKTPENVNVDTPLSISQTKFPEEKTLTAYIGKDGLYYFSISDLEVRIGALESMGKKYSISFSEAEKTNFKNIQEFGVPMNKMKSFLNLSADNQKKYKDSIGIPCDSIDTELVDWIVYTIAAGKKVYPNDSIDMKLGIKGDLSVKYPKFKNLIDQLQKRSINKFSLITNPKSIR